MRARWLALIALAAATAGCGTQHGLHLPFGGKPEPAEPDSAALRMAALEQRMEGLDAALERIEGLMRQHNAEMTAQLDELGTTVRTVGERVSSLDRRSMGETRGLIPGRESMPGAYPRTDGQPVTLDQGTNPFGIPARGDTLSPVPAWDRGGGPAGNAPAPGPGGASAPGSASGEPLGARLDMDEGESVSSGSAEGGLPDPSGEGQRLYQIAYQDLMEENFQLALINFRAFLDRFPGTRLSDNAQYWIGEVYYGQHQFQTAIEEFRRVIEDYPNGDKVPAAYYKIALCFQNLRDLPTARRYLQFLIKQYPDAREARLAEATLQEL
jgi:tol-pal system protein YbgF